MKFMLVWMMILSSQVFAQNITLPAWKYNVTDISSLNVKKEALFSQMNREFVKVSSSICSNRALMWVNDFKTRHNIDAAKVFLFYTGKTGRVGRKTWWYHVSPVVNEQGTLWAMDAGFGNDFNRPLLIQDWFFEFAGTKNCQEIKATQTELIERMFITTVFPGRTQYGTADCYYHIAPAGYWTPESVAMGLLGKDYQGRPVYYVRDDIDEGDLMQACVEASTSRLGRVFGNNKKKCEAYVRSGRYPRN
jgi:hypothetical protein